LSRIWSNADLTADGTARSRIRRFARRRLAYGDRARYPLADDAVRYVGQPVVVSLLTRRQAGRGGASDVEYEIAASPMRVAVEPGAPQFRTERAPSRASRSGGGRCCAASAAHVVKVLHNQRLAAFRSEPRAAIAITPTDAQRCTPDANSRPAPAICSARRSARSRGLPLNGDIGGGFG
jgi:hypothetical protein